MSRRTTSEERQATITGVPPPTMGPREVRAVVITVSIFLWLHVVGVHVWRLDGHWRG